MKLSDKMPLTNKIRQYQEEIHRINCRNFEAMTRGGAIITGAVVLVGVVFRSYTEFILEYGMLFAYMLAMFFLARYCSRHQTRHIELIYYAVITPVLVGGVLMGTFLDPGKQAITIFILMCIMTLFIIDKPVNNLLYMLAIAILFAVCSYLSKEPDIFMADILDLVIFWCISVGVNYFMLKGQVENAENYCLLQHESERDKLTGLYNRGAGEERVRRAIEQHETGSFVILDIDDFKIVNDSYGHKVGDEAICEIARILKAIYRPEDVVFRLGGDEFAIYAPKLTDEQLCRNRFEDMIHAAECIFTSDKACTSVGLSIGCTIYRGEKTDFDSIYYSSDKALYSAKNSGKNKAIITYFQQEK